jgi:hypothetical protein
MAKTSELQGGFVFPREKTAKEYNDLFLFYKKSEKIQPLKQ